MEFVSEYGEPINIKLSLNAQGFAHSGELMPVMKMLDRLFESDGNKQTDDNRRNMDEERLPAMNSVMGCVNVQHGR